MNLKKIIALTIGLYVLPVLAFGATPLIDNPKQIKAGVLEAAFRPTLNAIAVSTAGLRTSLTLETTTRIAADAALLSGLTEETTTRIAADEAIAVDTSSIKVLLDAVVVSTGAFLSVETDPITGAITGLVKADGAGNISAATAGIDYLTAEHDPVVGAISGIVKADGAGVISAATVGTDYLAVEADPVVGAVTGLIKADGAGNISAATVGVDYLSPTGDGSGLTGVVYSLVAGSNVTLTPAIGTGTVTIDVTGGSGDAVLAATQTFTGDNTFRGITTIESDGAYSALVHRDVGDTSGGGNLGFYGLSNDHNFFASNAYFDGANWLVSKNGGASLLSFNNSSGAAYNGGRFTLYISTARAADEALGASSEILNVIGLADVNGQLVPMSKFAGEVKVIGARFPSLVLEDEGDDNGILSLGGYTGTFTAQANNLYYDYAAATWKHSNDGGASLIYSDISTGGTGGFVSIRTAATQTAGTAATLTEVLTVTASSVTVSGVIGATSFDMARELITTVCASATSCVATCTGSKVTMGGECSASPQVSPLDGVLADTTNTCTAGTTANITAQAICVNAQ